MANIKLEPVDDQDKFLEELDDAGNLLELQYDEDELRDSRRRKTGRALPGTSGSSVCRLCCLAVSRLTCSVNDKVIQNFLKLLPSLSLSDHRSQLICQLCFSKAKICVDFILKIQHSQKNLASKGKISVKPVQSLLKKDPKVSAQDVLNKMKRLGGLNIKKVAAKRARPADLDDDFNWPMEPEIKKSTVATRKTTRKPAKKLKHESESDSDDDYEVDSNSSDSDERPSTSSSKRKRRSATSDSDEASQSSNRMETEFIAPPPAKYSCGKCKNYFKDLPALMGHVKDKTCVSRGFPCEICGKVYETNSKLNNHKESHEEKPVVFCDQCGKDFKDGFALEAHIEAIHQRVVRTDCVFRCSKCPDSFNSHLDLLNHVKIHKNSPTMPCSVCGKEVLKASYHSHMQWHKQDKTHSCDTCGKTFYQKYQLRNHMHNHNGIKEFPCDYCDKTYANGNAKRRHIGQAHPEEVPSARLFKYNK